MDFDECLMICLGKDLGAGQGRVVEGRERGELLLFYGAFKWRACSSTGPVGHGSRPWISYLEKKKKEITEIMLVWFIRFAGSPKPFFFLSVHTHQSSFTPLFLLSMSVASLPARPPCPCINLPEIAMKQELLIDRYILRFPESPPRRGQALTPPCM